MLPMVSVLVLVLVQVVLVLVLVMVLVMVLVLVLVLMMTGCEVPRRRNTGRGSRGGPGGAGGNCPSSSPGLGPPRARRQGRCGARAAGVAAVRAYGYMQAAPWRSGPGRALG